MADDADEAVELIGRMIALLMNLEFSFATRYGKSCPVCGGDETEDYGYTTRGPDRGHEKGCELRAVLDDVGLDEHTEGGGE